MLNGDQNVLDRLSYLYRERYGIEPTQSTKDNMLADWQLANRQGFRYLTDPLADTIVSFAKP